MTHKTKQSEFFKNAGSPFTELFSLLKRYDHSSEGLPTLAYDAHELKVIDQHIDNAINVLLQGLQDVGHLMGISSSGESVSAELSHIGFFISAITNLTEALNDLRSDTDYVLRKRGVSNY